MMAWALFVLFVTGLLTPADAMNYYVSNTGADNAPGTEPRPFATLGKACSVLQPGDTCYLRGGVYREVLRPVRSGKPGKPIIFTKYRDERVILSGADPIAGWRREADGVYSAPMPWTMPDGNQVFFNGEMLVEACWPNPGPAHLFQPERATAATAGTETTLRCDQLTGAMDAWKGARLWCAGGSGWICWSSTVTGFDPETHTLTFEPKREKSYRPRKGNPFVLRGSRLALDAPGEWLYDAERNRLLLIPPTGGAPAAGAVEAKRRDYVMDLAGRSWIEIAGIEFQAGGVKTDAGSHHITLKNLTGHYVAHSYDKDTSDRAVLLHGKHLLLLNSDIGYSSAAVVHVQGEDNRVINCHLHHGGYAGLWRGTVVLSGRRIVFSHNTVRHAGRDLVNTHGLMESLVQYNDLSDAGWLTNDLGMLYGHNTDYANTEFRYNFVHDNRARQSPLGIYFDHLSHNAIVHHNVIWNVRADPVRFNNPAYNNLVFNNSCWNTGNFATFDHSKRNDLFACRYFHNVYNGQSFLPAHVAVYQNFSTRENVYRNPDAQDFRLLEPVQQANPGIGAYASGGEPWRAGCHPGNPPDPLPEYAPPRIAWMNTVRNACFEFGTLEGWTTTDAGTAQLTKGNGWGNAGFGGSKENHPTGTSRFELQLGPGRDGVEQVIEGLSPDTPYELSAWLRVSGADETIMLGVKDHGMPEQTAAHSGTEWTRKTVAFTTGPQATRATIYLRKTSPGNGRAWADNVTLPLTPKETKGTQQIMHHTDRSDLPVVRLREDFLKLKFGMFLHFNLETYKGVQWVAGYHSPADFNPGGPIDTDAWAEAAKAAGMQYAVLTAKHVSGFCLWDSKYTAYDVMNPKCPYQQDLVAQFVKSFTSRGLKVGLYYCWRHPGFAGPYKVLPPECDPATHSLPEQIEFQKKQIAELVEKFPQVFYLWNDGLDPDIMPAEQAAAFVRSLRPGLLASGNWWDWKKKGLPYLDIAVTETRHFPATNAVPGETCWCLEKSWFSDGTGPKSAEEIVKQLRIANSRNANFLLNVGPDKQGKLHQASVTVLREVGQLLKQTTENK